MKWQCPRCQSTDLKVMVAIRDWAVLVQENDGNFQTDLKAGDHEWDDTSDMECRDCELGGPAHAFTVPTSCEAYVKMKGKYCPACGSFDVEGEDFEIEEGQCTQKVWCSRCNAQWLDVYELKGYMGLNTERRLNLAGSTTTQ